MLVKPELMPNQAGVEPVAGDEGLMVAGLDNVAVLEGQDPVGVTDGAQAVGDDQACAALHQPIKGLLNEYLAFGIESAGCLVQDQDAGSLRMARAMDSRWRCPPERLTPRSPRMVS